MSVAPDHVKKRCAALYGSEAARYLLGDSLHPGGLELTARLADALDVGPGSVVVDVASGFGTSAILLAQRTGCDVVGVDLSRVSVEAAREEAARVGLARSVRFVEGDAEALPLGAESADGVLCECAFCTFPAKEAAALELARVLRPGGVLALSDVTAEHDRLPAELRSLEARVACLGDARSLDELASLLRDAGLAVELAERHDDELAAMAERVEARLRVARTFLGGLVEPLLGLARAAREAIADGAIGYAVVIARKRHPDTIRGI